MPSHIAVSCPLLAVNCFTMNTLPIKSLNQYFAPEVTR